MVVAILFVKCSESKRDALNKSNGSLPNDIFSSANSSFRSSVIKIITYTEDSTLISEIMFDTASGKKEGLTKIFYKNGRLKEEGLWLDDKQSGTWSFYDELGRVKSKINFKNDNQDGLSLFYNANGVVLEATQFKDGKLDGTSTQYYPSGKKRRLTKWIAGEKQSEQFFSE